MLTKQLYFSSLSERERQGSAKSASQSTVQVIRSVLGFKKRNVASLCHSNGNQEKEARNSTCTVRDSVRKINSDSFESCTRGFCRIFESLHRPLFESSFYCNTVHLQAWIGICMHRSNQNLPGQGLSVLACEREPCSVAMWGAVKEEKGTTDEEAQKVRWLKPHCTTLCRVGKEIIWFKGQQNRSCPAVRQCRCKDVLGAVFLQYRFHNPFYLR